MNCLLEEAVIPAIRRLDRRFFRDEEMLSIAVPVRLYDTGLLIRILADEDSNHVVVSCQLPMSIPTARIPALAVKLAEINARWMFVNFYLLDGDVMADVCLDLTSVSDPESHIVRGFLRLCSALEDEYPLIVRVAKGRGRQRSTRLDREIGQIIGQFNS